MTRNLKTISALVILLAAVGSTANARCAAGDGHAACAGPNGAVAAGPNGVHGATYHSTTYHSTTVAAGSSVTGYHGNTATKAVQSGCAWVNGKRVCN
jgi:hypothetical protein